MEVFRISLSFPYFAPICFSYTWAPIMADLKTIEEAFRLAHSHPSLLRASVRDDGPDSATVTAHWSQPSPAMRSRFTFCRTHHVKGSAKLIFESEELYRWRAVFVSRRWQDSFRCDNGAKWSLEPVPRKLEGGDSNKHHRRGHSSYCPYGLQEWNTRGREQQKSLNFSRKTVSLNFVLQKSFDLIHLSLHGEVYTDNELGGIAISPDCLKVAYIAEKKKPKTEPFCKTTNETSGQVSSKRFVTGTVETDRFFRTRRTIPNKKLSGKSIQVC